MITLEKDRFFKINKNCYLCFIPINEDEYKYVIAINSHPSCLEVSGLEIYGYGNNCHEAMLMAIGNLANLANQAIPFDYLVDLTIPELFDLIKNKEGCLPNSLINIESKENEGFGSSTLSVNLVKNKAIGSFH